MRILVRDDAEDSFREITSIAADENYSRLTRPAPAPTHRQLSAVASRGMSQRHWNTRSLENGAGGVDDFIDLGRRKTAAIAGVIKDDCQQQLQLSA